MAPHMKRAADIGLAAISVEGGLISPEKLAEIAATPPDAKAAADYHCPKGTSLRDEITRYFRIGQAHWQAWSRVDKPTVTQTAAFAKMLLQEAFGFEALKGPADHIADGHRYRIAWEAKGGRVPIVVAAPIGNENGKTVEAFTKALPEFGDGDSEGVARRSPIALLQDWLNTSPACIWGLVVAGDRVRLMRDNASFTRPAYIEADLGAIFRDEMFADFTAVWLLIHGTRFGADAAPVGDSPLERWREAGQRAGTAARERLRESVEDTLLALGQGFLDANPDLRAKLDNQSLSIQAWFEQLLRVVYRLIFLAVAEDRDLLLSPNTSPAVRALYLHGYGFAHLRDRSVRRSAHDHHFDAWEGAQIVFRALEGGEKMLGLPALGGLFGHGLTPDLDGTKLPNRAFMSAVFKLSWLMDDNRRVRINWRDMATEELGSVYEGLLELVPVREDHGRTFSFAGGAEAKGNARKISGSYYTPDSLVQTLLDSALDPLLDRAEAEGGPNAILALNVIDPACGSGHFLLGAARRMATRVAQLRDNDAPDYPAAMRDVVRNCIHGVDRNPMAVELAKVALWIETVEPGKPLGFLDPNIQCGDSLLGIFDLKALEEGIPDGAYKALTGDDKEVAKWFANRNKAERGGQGSFDWARGGGGLPPAKLAAEMDDLRHLPEDTVEQVEAKRKRFAAWTSDPKRWATKVACDIYTAAFLLPKRGGIPTNANSATIPTTAHVRSRLGGGSLYGPLEAASIDAAGYAGAFHWPLAFPEVMITRGGFDLVLGNPPWEVVQFGEEEYFAARDPMIAALTGAARKRAIASLEAEHPVMFGQFQRDKRISEAMNEFARHSGRFELTARGKINTYGLFAEHFQRLTTVTGRAGLIVPTGIATDATTAPFFSFLVNERRLLCLFDFENSAPIFPGVHRSFKFSLLTLGQASEAAAFAFFLTTTSELQDTRRRFVLTPLQIALINPNTRTAPVFRAQADAQLITKIYGRTPVLMDEAKGRKGNPWGVEFRQGLFNMASDSRLFRTRPELIRAGYAQDGADWTKERPASNDEYSRYLPLYEAKMFDQYNYRYADYSGRGEDRGHRVLPELTEGDLADPKREPEPYYWVPLDEVVKRREKQSSLMGYGEATTASTARTMVATTFPYAGVGHKEILIFLESNAQLAACFFGNLNSLVLDTICRTKVSYINLGQYIVKQLPILPPSAYSDSDLAFIVPKVLELNYNSHSMAAYARDLGFHGPPFAWNEARRSILRAELDAWYALAYGFLRDELRYVLDPKEVMGADYPSETFRVLEKDEVTRFGEYRTARLVLAAYDRLVSEGVRPRTDGYG